MKSYENFVEAFKTGSWNMRNSTKVFATALALAVSVGIGGTVAYANDSAKEDSSEAARWKAEQAAVDAETARAVAAYNKEIAEQDAFWAAVDKRKAAEAKTHEAE